MSLIAGLNSTSKVTDIRVTTDGKIKVQAISDGDAPSASQTRPNNTTAYAAGDVVGTDAATNMTFSNVVTISGAKILIPCVFLRVDVSAIPAGMGMFKLHLFNAAPTAITDNLAWSLANDDRGKYLGYITLNTPIDVGGTLWSQTPDANYACKLAVGSTTLYGQLETVAAYTPTAQAVKTITFCAWVV